MLKPSEYYKTVRRPYPPLMSSIFYSAFADEDLIESVIGERVAQKEVAKIDYVYYYGKKYLDEINQKVFDACVTKKKFYEIKKKILALEKKLKNSLNKEPMEFLKVWREYSVNIVLIWWVERLVEESTIAALQRELNEEETAKLMETLTLPLEDNFYKQEEHDLCNTNDIKKHVQKYVWLKSRYGKDVAYTEKEVKKHKESLDGNLLDKDKKQKILIKKAIRRAKELTNNPELIDFLQFCVYYRTQRTDILNKTWYQYIPQFKEFAESLDLTYEEFLYCTNDEVPNDIPDKKLIHERMEYYIFLVENGERTFYSGEKAKEITKKFEQRIDTNELKGIIACKGKVKGKAVIIVDMADFKKMEEGNILITSMTTPNMVSILKKAAAFVTDEGGITCHAAIISREMNKPCIIGTQYATQVFKDGDLVELDAEKGVIRKIKR